LERPALPEAEADLATVPLDLGALLAAMTALRQEVKLQTRTARQDREQAAGVLSQLTHTVTQLEQRREDEASQQEAAAQEAQRLAVETLLDLHEALSRSGRQAVLLLSTVSTTLREWSALEVPSAAASRVPRPEPPLPAMPPVVVRPRSWYQGWFRRREAPAVRRPEPLVLPPPSDRRAEQARAALTQITGSAAQMAARLEGLAEGVQLNVQRLERALAVYDLEPLACLGQPVDPALMEVVQIVVDAAQPPGVVVDEVRRGYRRHGQVYRFAQVVATSAPVPPPLELPAEAEHGPEQESNPGEGSV